MDLMSNALTLTCLISALNYWFESFYGGGLITNGEMKPDVLATGPGTSASGLTGALGLLTSASGLAGASGLCTPASVRTGA